MLRESGELRAYAGKDCREHVEEFHVVLESTVRVAEKQVAEAARAMNDLGDDGRGSLGPRVLAIPVHGGYLNHDAKWAFFRTDTDDARDDWLLAFTTLAVLHDKRRKKSGRLHIAIPEAAEDILVEEDPAMRGGVSTSVTTIDDESHAAEEEHAWLVDSYDSVVKKKQQPPLVSPRAKQQPAVKKQQEPAVKQEKVLRQGYLKMKVSQKTVGPNVAAQAALELATRLEPWRRRWFVLRGRQLKWYVSPPADAAEVPSGVLKMSRAIVSVSNVEHEKSVYKTTMDDQTSRDAPFEFSVVVQNASALKLRCSAHDDGKEWVRSLRSAAMDDEHYYSIGTTTKWSRLESSDSRTAKLEACRRDPSLVIDAPDVAYALLVPVDRSDGVDRTAWRQVAEGQYLGPLSDAYVADVVYDALVGTEVEPSEDHVDDDFLPTTDRTGSPPPPTTLLPSDNSGPSTTERTTFRMKKHLTMTYTAAKKFGVDASLKVSELLQPDNKDALARRAQADVKTSRREAEALTWRDLRLSDEAFRRYCETYRSVVRDAATQWDDLRCRLGVDICETLVVRDDHVVDQHGDEGILFLTDRRLYFKARTKVIIVDLLELLTVDGLRASKKASADTMSDLVLRLRFKPGLQRHISVVSLQRPPQPSNDALLGDYPGGGKLFGNSVLRPADDDDVVTHGGDADLSDADDDLDLADVKISKRVLYEDNNNTGDPSADDNSNETTASSNSGTFFEARCFEDDCYSLRLPKPKAPSRVVSSATSSTSQAPSKVADERARRWLESLRELVAANAILTRFDQTAMFSSRAAFDAALKYYWTDVRGDAKKFGSQQEFFAVDRRKLPLWVALNLVRREALFRCCGRAPKRLLVCTHDRGASILRRFLDGETCWRLDRIRPSGSWFRSAVAYTSRVEDMQRKKRNDIETFSPARFRDEWTTFWHHVDPIWDGFFDTIAQLRQWDQPVASFLVFMTLILLSAADQLQYLPALMFLSYAGIVVVNGHRVAHRRDRRRKRRLKLRKGTPPPVDKMHKASRKILGFFGGVVKGKKAAESEDDRVDESHHSVDDESTEVVLDDDNNNNSNGPPQHDDDGSQRVEQPPTKEMTTQQQTQEKISPKQRLDQKAMEQFFGFFGQFRELRLGLGRAQAKLHEYNTSLLHWRALHRWSDPRRTSWFVAGLGIMAIFCVLIPLNILFGLGVLYFFSDPLFKQRGLSRALQDEYFDGLPTPSRTHGNVHFAALKRREPPVFPPAKPFLYFGLGGGKTLRTPEDDAGDDVDPLSGGGGGGKLENKVPGLRHRSSWRRPASSMSSSSSS